MRARSTMFRLTGRLLALGLAIALVMPGSGCARLPAVSEQFSAPTMPVALTSIEYPDVEVPVPDNFFTPERPRTVRDLADAEYWDLSLAEAMRLALENSKVLRDLGGTVVRAPETSPTALDPAITETDPRFGVEAALSAFDARLDSRLSGEKVDRRFNNQFLGSLGFLQADRDVWETQIAKRSATGSLFSLRQHWDFDKDNNPGNQFPDGAWNVWYEAEARQPLWQGGGLDFNRIAGPGATPGVYNGVLIARIRTDITLADFEVALRDFASNVENAYWDLYFAYRDLDAKVRARDTALETWRRIDALFETGRRGGEAEKEAQAREQYYRFEADVQDALAGRPLDGTRTNNGSRPGTFRGLPGVLVAEKRLRLMLNVPANSEQLIRPADEPAEAAIAFDWPTITTEALTRRSELRRQRWNVKRRELELLAARNFLMPKLDVVGLYRFRGFGDNLMSSDGNTPPFNNAYSNLATADFQEWQAGLELSMTLGFRQAHAGVRNAELHLSRERILLQSQEREVVYDLAQAVAEMDRAFLVMQTNYNRWVAAGHQLAAVEAAFADDRVQFIAVLDAQRRAAEAEAQQYRSRVEYAVAVKNVHFEKGTLLDYLGIIAAEGPWPGAAYGDAFRREVSRLRERQIPPQALLIGTGDQPPGMSLPLGPHEPAGKLPEQVESIPPELAPLAHEERVLPATNSPAKNGALILPATMPFPHQQPTTKAAAKEPPAIQGVQEPPGKATPPASEKPAPRPAPAIQGVADPVENQGASRPRAAVPAKPTPAIKGL